MKRFLSVIFIFFLPLVGLYAGQKNFYIELKSFAGTVPGIYSLSPKESITTGFELGLGFKSTGTHRWHRIFNYPYYGINLNYSNLGNNAIYGSCFTLTPTFTYPLRKTWKNGEYRGDLPWQHNIIFGLGLAYFNNPYNAQTNPTNMSMGSHYSWAFNLGYQESLKLNRSSMLSFGAEWHHASNSHTKLPNVGVNNIQLMLGYRFFPSGLEPVSYADFNGEEGKRNRWTGNIRIGMGYHEFGGTYGPVGKGAFPVYSISAYAGRKFGDIWKLNAGLSYRYYQSFYEYIRRYETFPKAQKWHSSALIAFVGNEFQFGHYSVNVDIGVNLYKPFYRTFFDLYEHDGKFQYALKNTFANRFGFYVYLRDPSHNPDQNVFLGTNISANFGQADYLDFNLGYVF